MEKNKQEMRKEFLAFRSTLSDETCMMKSRMICERIQKSEAYQKADVIYMYMAYRKEVDLKFLMQFAYREKKTVAIPRIDDDQMTFHIVKFDSAMLPVTKRGYFQIMEPDKSAEPAPAPDLILFPGVVFGRDGNRIGYGKGFYDRYMKRSDADKAVTAGIGYECQIADYIPAEEHDFRLDYIITEENVYESCRRNHRAIT